MDGSFSRKNQQKLNGYQIILTQLDEIYFLKLGGAFIRTDELTAIFFELTQGNSILALDSLYVSSGFA